MLNSNSILALAFKLCFEFSVAPKLCIQQHLHYSRDHIKRIGEIFPILSRFTITSYRYISGIFSAFPSQLCAIFFKFRPAYCITVYERKFYKFQMLADKSFELK